MKNLGMKYLVVGLVSGIIFSTTGCEQSYSLVGGTKVETLPVTNPGGNPTPTPPQNCHPTLGTTTANLRIMFMVDNSGSTFGEDGTDPNFVYRAKAVESFLSQYASKTNFTYSFGYFNGTTARVYDTASRSFKKNSAPAPFGTAAQLANALALYQRQSTVDDTPYQAAFNAVSTEVSQDQAANGARYRYVLIFMSDGQPTDLSSPIQTSIRRLVANLKQIAGSTNPITVSAVYFGSDSDSDSIRNLTFMASDGSGQFVNTNHTTHFSIDDVITVPGPPSCN